MSRPLWLVRLIRLSFPGRFLLARMTRAPLIGQLLDRLLFDGDRIYYLPLDRTVVVHEAIPLPEEMVLPSQVVDHFIEQAGYHWVMNTCICREAAGCKDYPIDLGCVFLGEAARGIHPRLGRPVSREEALAHVRRARQAGLVHLIGRNKLDTVWLGIGPGDRLMTICHCCPCCCLWRVLPHLSPEIGGRTLKAPGVEVRVTERCIGCGTCSDGVCFVGAIDLVDDRAVIGDECRGCGRCVDACPQGAIEIRIDEGALAGSMGQLAELVDVT